MRTVLYVESSLAGITITCLIPLYMMHVKFLIPLLRSYRPLLLTIIVWCVTADTYRLGPEAVVGWGRAENLPAASVIGGRGHSCLIDGEAERSKLFQHLHP